MMINKNRFRVSNDKKILHKIGKRWVTVSALTLALLGGAAAASTVTTHAASVQSASTEKVAEKPAQSATPKNIMSAASNMHQGMLATAPKSVAPSSSASTKPSSASQSASSVSSSKASSAVSSVASGSSIASSSSVNSSSANSVNNKASDNQTVSPSSASVKFSIANNSNSKAFMMSYLNSLSNAAYNSEVATLNSNSANSAIPNNTINNLSNHRLGTNLQATQQATDTNWIWTENGYISDNQVHDWQNKPAYYGLTWKYSPSTQAAEFVSGKPTIPTMNYYLSGLLQTAKSIKLGSHVDTSNATQMVWFLSLNNNVRSIDAKHLDTRNVTNMHSIFGGNPNLVSLQLPENWDTSKVTNMSSMFQSDHSLKSIILPEGLNTNNVTNMNTMFQSDFSLNKLVLPQSFDTSNVIDMDKMFNATHLQSITLPKLFKTMNVKNFALLFANNPYLQKINLSIPFDTHNAINMSGMFDNDYQLSSQVLNNVISSFDTSNTTNMGGMFQSDHALTSLDLPSTFNTNNVKNMSDMFRNEHSLLSLTLPNCFDTRNVTTMSDMFGGDYPLIQLNLGPHFNTNNVKNMRLMFISDHSLHNLDLGPNFNTENVTNMSQMFSDDHTLQNVNLGHKFDTSKVTSMAHMFDSDYALNGLDLGSKFNTSNVSDMYMMFIKDGIHNSNGMNIKLSPNFNTTKAFGANNKGFNGKSNGISDMFQYTNIKSITIPSTAKFNAKSQLGSSWYPVASKSNKLETDNSGDYLTVPNANKTNLMDSNSHAGTWVKNPNVQKVNNTVAFTDNKTNDLVGSTTAYGALDSPYTIPTAPKGYSFINNDNTFKIVSPDTKVSIPVAKSNVTDNTNKDIPVAPTRDTDTIDYQYNNATKGSQQFSGNDQHATDAGDNSIDVDSKAATKMPAGYQLVNKDNNVPYDSGTHNIAITPIQQTDSIQFMNNGHQVGTTTTKGNDSRTGINGNSTATLPTGYQLANGANASVANDGEAHQINVTPIQKTDTINYQLNGVTKGSNQFTGNDSQANGATGTSFDVNSSNDAGMPQGYQLVDKDNRFNYDGGTHDVAIEATNQTANVNYNLPNGTNISSGTISGTVNGKATPNQAPQGYHFVGNVAPYTFTTANAGNNPSDNVTVAPNTYNGTATIHIKYDLGNGDIVNGTDQHVNVNGQYGQSDQVISSTNYCPMNDAYQDHNANWLIGFNDLTKNGSVSNGKLEHTFTYNATVAPSLVIRYDLIDQSNDKLVKKDIHDDTFTASQLGIKPQDWVVGNTIIIGTKKNGDTNKLDVISAPQGYHLVDNANGYGYKNTTESIQLEPNATVSGHPVVLMAMPMFFYHSQPNKPVTPSSASAKPSSAASSVAPSNASASVVPSSASQSTSSSAPARQIIDHGSIESKGNTPEPVNTPTSTPSNKPSDVTPANQPSDVVPVVHKHTTKPSVQKNTQPSDWIVNKNAGNTKAESRQLVEPSHHAAKVQHEAQNHMANISNKMAQPMVHVTNVHTSRINNAKHSANVQHKLPQTNETKAAGLMGAASIMAALGLAGADRKHKHEMY